VLGLLPASAGAVHIVHWLVTRIMPPRTLPKLEFQHGVSSEFSTVVVIPAIFKTESEIQSLLNQLESHFIGNADPNIHFALLTDFTDAPQKEMPGEEQLLVYAKAGIKQLNERHGNKSYRPFYYCIVKEFGIPPRVSGWAGSASAANWKNSTSC
jgi:cyclic beta-1,2-glucan synthetase